LVHNCCSLERQW
jgi:hypothetical protein